MRILPAGRHLRKSSSACTPLGHLLCAQIKAPRRTQWRLHLQRPARLAGWMDSGIPSYDYKAWSHELARLPREKKTSSNVPAAAGRGGTGSTRPRLTAGTWSGRCTCTCPSNPVIGRRKLLADLAWVNNNPNKGEVDRQL